MRIKTFYAKSMAEAFREIKKHLGSDAIMLSSKEIPSRSGVWGRSSGFEVVAACDDSGNVDVLSGNTKYENIEEKTLSSRERTFSYDMEASESPDGIVETGTYSPAKLARMQTAASSKSQKLNIPRHPASDTKKQITEKEEKLPFKGKVATAVYHEFIDNGVDAILTRDLLEKALEGLTPGQRRSRSALLSSVAQAALRMLPAMPNRNGMPKKKVVAFVGPTGVGKTTSIAKLAAHLALKKNKKVMLVTTDGYRIGAIDQLRTYAGLMGIPFRFVDQVPDLMHMIEENKNRDYILIDTAGRSPRDLGPMQPLADYLRQSSEIERHLVLSLNTNPRDMRTCMDTFETCGPDHLLFTKLDETSMPGPILNEIIRTQKSISYYCDGQRVPEDIHTVTSDCIMDIVLNRNNVAFKG